MEGKYFVLIKTKGELDILYEFLINKGFKITHPEIFLENNVERPFALSIHKDKTGLGYVSFICVGVLSSYKENSKYSSVYDFINNHSNI